MSAITQNCASQTVINIFEASEVLDDCRNATSIDGDTGHLAFDRTHHDDQRTVLIGLCVTVREPKR